MGMPMFGNLLQDFDVEPLRPIIEFELVRLPPAAQESLWSALELTFSLWKDECTTNQSFDTGSLLGNPLLTFGKTYEQAEPWLCAGFGVRCRTELAYKLWIENYERFKKITDTLGVLPVFALLALREDASHAPAIIRVAGMLADVRYKSFADYFANANRRDQKRLLILAEGRKKGASVLKAKSEQAMRGMRDFARSYFMQYPSVTYDDVVKVLLTKSYADKPGGGRYAPRRILDVIRGVKQEALTALSNKNK